MSANQFLINTSAAEWNHAIGDEYTLISEFGKENIRQKCTDDNLLKIAVKIPLQDLVVTGEMITELLPANCIRIKNQFPKTMKKIFDLVVPKLALVFDFSFFCEIFYNQYRLIAYF